MTLVQKHDFWKAWKGDKEAMEGQPTPRKHAMVTPEKSAARLMDVDSDWRGRKRAIPNACISSGNLYGVLEKINMMQS